MGCRIAGRIVDLHKLERRPAPGRTQRQTAYAPNIELAGGRIVRVPLVPRSFRPDFERIAAALGPRTRMIVVNSPHNPGAVVWTRAEMERLAALLAPTDTLLVSRSRIVDSADSSTRSHTPAGSVAPIG